LPTLRQRPLGPRQVASAGHRRCNSIHIGIAEGANIRLVRYLLTDLGATGFSDWTHSAGRSCRRMLLLPVIAVAAARGSAQLSALRMIELYQGLVRAFQRCGKDYELRCGKLYARTIAAFADRQYAYRGKFLIWLTHVLRRSS
jgi:hypothetical protein